MFMGSGLVCQNAHVQRKLPFCGIMQIVSDIRIKQRNNQTDAISHCK